MAFMPLSPPPPFVPTPTATSYIIDCLQNYTYVWLWNGESFWFYPTRVEYGEVSGYRWNGAFWAFYGIDPRLIMSVSCPPIPTLY
ncbi:transporter [Paenibacillus sp. CECT 9249]|uniref:transporter n=1 Tax=Paenibacillus sp. CECT 9249 TaxID=2845385 RepID=UPI001E4DBF24|nr:transporter [Paenibacillus sp. CECT 9249]